MVQKYSNAIAGSGLLATLCVLAAWAPAANAQVTTTAVTTIAAPEHPSPVPPVHPATAAKPTAAGQYYIEFRSRYAQSYGHTYLVHGRVGQKITANDVAGLHPAGDDPTPWVIGHFIWVPSETGASDGDTEEKYVSARYRILMNKAQYDRVVAHIKDLQAHSPLWNAGLYNCNAFVADVAKFMGLKTPKSTLLYPKVFITNLRLINTGHPEAADTVFEENQKEMQSPTRDGVAMERSGIRTIQAERKKPATGTVTIGHIRTTSGAGRSAEAAAPRPSAQ